MKKVYLADTEAICDYWGIYLIEQDVEAKQENLIKFEWFGSDTQIDGLQVKELLELLNNNVLVCHNMGYDAHMIKGLMRALKGHVTVSDMHERNQEYFNSTLNMIQQQREGNQTAKKLGANPTGNGDYKFICVDSLKNTQKSLKVLQFSMGIKVMVESFEDGKSWDTRFLEYFENDVFSLQHIWNKHWALRQTYDTKRNALDILGVELKHVDYGSGEETIDDITGHEYASPLAFLNPVFAIDDPQERKYAKIDFKDIPPVENPEFKEHIAKYTKGVQGSDNDDSKKTEVVLWNNNVVYSGGGFHSTYIGQELFLADDEYAIIHADVGSLYPNIVRTNAHYFTHMNIELYTSLIYKRMEIKEKSKDHYLTKEQRKELKKESNAYKLLLNSSYGIMNMDVDIDDPNVYNKLGYKKGGQYICLRGHQLLISIIELYFKHIPNDAMKLIQGNTDGVFIQVKREYLDDIKELSKQWEVDNDMTLDVHDFSMIFQRSVNEYIAIESDGSLELKGNLDWNQLEASTQTSLPLTIRECIGHLVGAVPTQPTEIKPILDKSNGSLWYLTSVDTGYYPYTGKPSALNPQHYTDAQEQNRYAKDTGKRAWSRGKIGGCREGFFLTDNPNQADINVYMRLAELYIIQRTDSDITDLKLKKPMISFIDPSEAELKTNNGKAHLLNATAFIKSEIKPKLTSKYLKPVGGSRRKDEWKNKELEHLKELLEENHHFIMGHFKGGKRLNENIMGQNVGYFDLDEGFLPPLEETRQILADECNIKCFMGYYTLSATDEKRKQRHFFLLDKTFRATELDIYKKWFSDLTSEVYEKTQLKNDSATETLGYVAYARNSEMDFYIQEANTILDWFPVVIKDETILEAKSSEVFK